MTDEVVIHVLLLKKKREYETYDSLICLFLRLLLCLMQITENTCLIIYKQLFTICESQLNFYWKHRWKKSYSKLLLSYCSGTCRVKFTLHVPWIVFTVHDRIGSGPNLNVLDRVRSRKNKFIFFIFNYVLFKKIVFNII